jgi:hypothetical protein
MGICGNILRQDSVPFHLADVRLPRGEARHVESLDLVEVFLAGDTQRQDCLIVWVVSVSEDVYRLAPPVRDRSGLVRLGIFTPGLT